MCSDQVIYLTTLGCGQVSAPYSSVLEHLKYIGVTTTEPLRVITRKDTTIVFAVPGLLDREWELPINLFVEKQ